MKRSRGLAVVLALWISASCGRSAGYAEGPSAGPLLTQEQISAILVGREDVCVLLVPSTMGEPSVTFFRVLEALKSNATLYETLVGSIVPGPEAMGLSCVAAPAADSAQYASEAMRKAGVRGRVYVRTDVGGFVPLEPR